MAALILPAITLIWEIVKAIFFNKSDDPTVASEAAVEKFRGELAKVRAAIQKSQDTEGNTQGIEDEINHRKP